MGRGAIQVEGLVPDYLIGTLEEIQSQYALAFVFLSRFLTYLCRLWIQILNNFVAGQGVGE